MEADKLQQYPCSVLERGYGIVGKLVMQDRRLHITAKAIYAYLCTFGNTAYPGREKVCFDLDISKNTYAKYMQQLVAFGYVTVEQKKNYRGEFQMNIYTINLDSRTIVSEKREETLALLCELASADAEKDKENVSEQKSIPERKSTVSQITVQGKKGEISHRVPNYGTPSFVTHNNTRSNITNKTTTTPVRDGAERRSGDPPEENALPSRIQCSPMKECVVVSDELRSRGSSLGISEKTLRKLVRKFGSSMVTEKLALLAKTGRGKVANPSGWLYSALNEDYEDTDKARRVATRERHKEQEERWQKRREEQAAFEERRKNRSPAEIRDEIIARYKKGLNHAKTPEEQSFFRELLQRVQASVTLPLSTYNILERG